MWAKSSQILKVEADRYYIAKYCVFWVYQPYFTWMFRLHFACQGIFKEDVFFFSCHLCHLLFGRICSPSVKLPAIYQAGRGKKNAIELHLDGKLRIRLLWSFTYFKIKSQGIINYLLSFSPSLNEHTVLKYKKNSSGRSK